MAGSKERPSRGERNDTILRSLHVPLAIEDARNTLLEGSSVATWFGAVRADVDPQEGGRFEVFWHPEGEIDSTMGCKIEELSKDRIVVSWRGPTKHAMFEGMDKPGSTNVTFDLDPEGDWTTINIAHAGFSNIPDGEKAFQYYSNRWSIWAHNLNLVCSVAGRLSAAQEVMAAAAKLNPALQEHKAFTPDPGEGMRQRFDFTQISLETGRLFGGPVGPVAKNVVDQA